MTFASKDDLKFEIGHVLFIDIVETARCQSLERP